MKLLELLLGVFISIFVCSACTSSATNKSQNNDPELLGKWIRNNKYYIDLYDNGVGSKDKNVTVTEDIKKYKNERINWVTFNNNFLIINTDEEVLGFSYEVIADTLFLRQPEDNLEFFIRVKEENNK